MVVLKRCDSGRIMEIADDPRDWEGPRGVSVEVGASTCIGSSTTAHEPAMTGACRCKALVLT